MLASRERIRATVPPPPAAVDEPTPAGYTLNHMAQRPRASAADLFRAIESDDADAIRAAIANGANPTEEDDGGITPLGLAAYKGLRRAVRVLLDCGADAAWMR